MDAPKKMSLTQLTFIVAVNMMGSGIIMLPTNMAQVGAISLLSWIVTALGSMAIAYGFAQAGVFNQRPGGMAAYAEDAYGKDGYFQVFILYFLSLAIGNVAIAVTAVGYLSGFVPWLASAPIATTIGAIGLIWLTTVANLGGPSVTGKIGSVTVWGVILPVGLLSFMGWFWFSADTFSAAWNPNGLSIGEGMGSSIALTLWAFLGMESAAQNSDAVENPKRDVPLACMFGTLGAAVIYVLSTTVIQGIVPNADLAASTGPFALAYAQMFSPTIGSIVMALAVLACLGSLLGWQFTIAQTGKSAADENMFPAFFSKVNKGGAPYMGMLVLGVVQSLLALSTISPNLSEQFGKLVNLAVVTNVVPYVVALSALMVMMKKENVSQGVYRRNAAIAVVAMLYSVYALYASGMEAVMGGMLVMGLGYVVWGFIAHRFTEGTAAPADRSSTMKDAGSAATSAVLILAVGAAALLAQPAQAQTPQQAQAVQTQQAAPQGALDRIRASGTIRLGHRADAEPYSFSRGSAPAGYSVDLCGQVVEALSRQLGGAAIQVQWVPVTLANRFQAVQQGQVDLLCGAASETLERRAQVAFSVPIFPGGIGALMRVDASRNLRDVLNERPRTDPVWRGSAGRVLTEQTFSVVTGTTAQPWIAERLVDLKVSAEVAPVPDYAAGIQAVVDRDADVLFGDRAILMDAALRSPSANDLMVIERLFTYEPTALVMARGDEDFRLAVDTALSEFYASGALEALYVEWFGEADENARNFFRWNALR